MSGIVVAVSSSAKHALSKQNQESIQLLAGLGVDGDAHLGETVRHRSGATRLPPAPNLRQVHLVHRELFDELKAGGFAIGPGQIGENITTRDVDLLRLPTGTELHLGATAVVRVTGLREPCSQLDRFQRGLKAAMLRRGPDGKLSPLCGIMGIVLVSGEVRPGDRIRIELPEDPHQPLVPV
jgi:MOSC domain-containing protein YiiM